MFLRKVHLHMSNHLFSLLIILILSKLTENIHVTHYYKDGVY